MTVYRNPNVSQWSEIVTRPVFDTATLEKNIQPIIDDVRKNGDKAVRKYTKQFDGADIGDFFVSERERYFALNQVSPELFDAIKVAAANITAFHRKQVTAPEKIETTEGVVCWRKNVPVESVGLYIPGGSAPLFSTVLMLGIPALIAGCKNISLYTPPSSEGLVHPAIIVAATYIGINKIVKTGGVQAIAAMTFGTESLPKVQKIFGPGNQYVTTAKQMVQKFGVAIDMPAGPSEVAVFADATADADFVASDLLSQAEHGADSQVLLVTTSADLIAAVEKSIEIQLADLPRRDLAQQALKNSKLVLVDNEQVAMQLLNRYAPEHLILSCANAAGMAEEVVNAGSVFLGHYSPESAGDYASGTNHTLPTNGYASTYSGVSVDSFVKKITFQQLNEKGLINLGPTVQTLAEAEGLHAHAKAVEIRLKKISINDSR
jgi:histidinol dehydrogenase